VREHSKEFFVSIIYKGSGILAVELFCSFPNPLPHIPLVGSIGETQEDGESEKICWREMEREGVGEESNHRRRESLVLF